MAISKEHLHDRDDKAEAGDATHDIYSMGHGGSHTHDAAERDSDLKPAPPKAPPASNEVLYWRIGLGFAIILIIAGVIYFIGKGINWGIRKISGPSESVATSSIYSNADPLLSMSSGPVVSNNNIIPVGGAAAISSSGTSSSSGQVAGAETSASQQGVNPANNCPFYTGNTYFYCQWQSEFVFRGFETAQDFAAANPVTPSSPSMPVPPPRSNNAQTPPGASLNQAIYASQVRSPVLPNGCPDYTGNTYDHCIWINSYTWRGFGDP